MLKVNNLSKKFPSNDYYSLKNVNFSIDQGEIVGLIGKNGAGKTTLLKMLAKSFYPSSGQILYKELDIFSKDNVLDSFGLMIETVYYSHLTVLENLEFYLNIHNKREYMNNIKSVLEVVELWDKRNKKPDGFSFGMKQRLSLAISLVIEPEFMILDEPFIGLDPDGVQLLMKILTEWALNKKIGIIISSHQLTELEEICDRFLFIENGELKDQFNKDNRIVTVIELEMPIQIDINKYKEEIHIDKKGTTIEIDSDSTVFTDILQDISKKQKINKIFTKENKLSSRFNGGRKDV